MQQTASIVAQESSDRNTQAVWSGSEAPIVTQPVVEYQQTAFNSNSTIGMNAMRSDTPPQRMFTDSENTNEFDVDLPLMSSPLTPIPSLHAIQEWEGYVIELNETEFIARLIDLTAGDTFEQEEAVIPRAELSNSDNAKLQNGSIFHWVIGYEGPPIGNRKPVSRITLRELPVVTEADLRNAEIWAREMAAFLDP